MFRGGGIHVGRGRRDPIVVQCDFFIHFGQLRLDRFGRNGFHVISNHPQKRQPVTAFFDFRFGGHLVVGDFERPINFGFDFIQRDHHKSILVANVMWTLNPRRLHSATHADDLNSFKNCSTGNDLK